MGYGFHDKILRVNLTTGELTTESPGEGFFRTYFGGWGLIAYYLLKELVPGTDPLGPENLLIFAPGVVTGAPIGGSGRNAVGAKSPLTGGFGEGDVGGYWGAELKRAGWDAIVVTGCSERPVYLWIADDQVELRDASALWGQETAEVERMLRAELGDERLRVAQCGIAGENLVRYANVMNDVTRAAGRTGLGAVMGSKRLKAVAVRGTLGVKIADREKVNSVSGWLRDNWPKLSQGLHDNGTADGLLDLDERGGLPTRNFQEGSFEGALKITGATMTDEILVERDNCFACPIACKRKVKTAGRHQTDPKYGGPEYETLGALGSCCGIDDLEAIAYGNQLCNAFGLDTISAGVTIAWAMECFERGLLTTKDTDGLDLRFGNADAMVTLVERIARREGFGNLLAEGSLRAARQIGRGTERYAMQVKGQEVPMHEPRIKFGLDLGYAISPTGADHVHNIHDTGFENAADLDDVRSIGILDPLPAKSLGPEKVRLAAYWINRQMLHNSMGMCMFLPYRLWHLCDMVQGITGWNSSAFELLKVGERALAMARAFNAREGFDSEDDEPPWRFSTAFESGPAAGVKVPAEEVAEAIELYYGMMGWDRDSGAPTRARLYELGIGWVADLF
ncbi:MAG: aldehyde ferredoxin oxidoreductase family protein [Anaerolineales bacterium]|nr:aldehyde ferredoxin oxidoreductase family protein [Anaerolineales bacterium]